MEYGQDDPLCVHGNQSPIPSLAPFAVWVSKSRKVGYRDVISRVFDNNDTWLLPPTLLWIDGPGIGVRTIEYEGQLQVVVVVVVVRLLLDN